MPDYTFHQLSNYDFEILTRNLLQKELDVTFESFTSGKDKGIDLRYSSNTKGDTIVQCKHYAKSNYSSLKRALKKEISKVKKLNPSRYILSTSKGLTPQNKDEIIELLSPYCVSVSDIYGREDLNNLLEKYPKIESNHYKLWFTSTNILERIIHSGIFGTAKAEIEHIKHRINRYVTNPSLNRANEILDKDQFCVIAGLPGIGKTTLAEMLLLGHFHNGYDCYRVWENISEVYEVFEPAKKQIFYFDDFLGRTGLKTKFSKNEDERLLRFIKDITRTDSSKLILTTREYILNQAKWIYEALSRIKLEASQCVIELKDYADFIRAQILYNHLYFSELPYPYLQEIVNQRAYRNIIDHRNYNPRIIETMTELINVRDCKPADYPDEFIANLDDPYKIWEVAFNNHLSKEAVNILLVLSTQPDITNYDVLKETFEEFHFYRAERYNRETDPYDFNRGLKELEHNFIQIISHKDEFLVEFHNPSIRDFVENIIRDNNEDANELLKCSLYPEQVSKLWEINSHRNEHKQWALSVLKKLHNQILVDSPFQYWETVKGEYMRFKEPTYFKRFILLCDISLNAEETIAKKLIGKEVLRAIEQVNGIALNEGLDLLILILKGKVLGENSKGNFFKVIYEELFSDIHLLFNEIFDFELLSYSFDDLKGVISKDTHYELENLFHEVCKSEINHVAENDGYDKAISLYDDTFDIATTLDFYFDPDPNQLDSLNPSNKKNKEENFIRHSDSDSKKTDSIEEIDQLFDSLVDN